MLKKVFIFAVIILAGRLAYANEAVKRSESPDSVKTMPVYNETYDGINATVVAEKNALNDISIQPVYSSGTKTTDTSNTVQTLLSGTYTSEEINALLSGGGTVVVEGTITVTSPTLDASSITENFNATVNVTSDSPVGGLVGFSNGGVTITSISSTTDASLATGTATITDSSLSSQIISGPISEPVTPLSTVTNGTVTNNTGATITSMSTTAEPEVTTTESEVTTKPKEKTSKETIINDRRKGHRDDWGDDEDVF